MKISVYLHTNGIEIHKYYVDSTTALVNHDINTIRFPKTMLPDVEKLVEKYENKHIVGMIFTKMIMISVLPKQ